MRPALLLAALAATAPTAHAAAGGFEFPKQFKWSFQFHLTNEKVGGVGKGVIDWTSDEELPRYWVEQSYDKTAPGASFRVTQDRVSGAAGEYTYAYATADGARGCLPAAFTAFPRKMFATNTWTGTVAYKGQTCNRYVAATPGSGAAGTIELLTCNDVPVMTRWTALGEGGMASEQVAYTTAYEPIAANTKLTEAPFHKLFTTCGGQQAGGIKFLLPVAQAQPQQAVAAAATSSDAHEPQEVQTIGNTVSLPTSSDGHEAPDVQVVPAQAAAGTIGASAVNPETVKNEQHEAPEVIVNVIPQQQQGQAQPQQTAAANRVLVKLIGANTNADPAATTSVGATNTKAEVAALSAEEQIKEAYRVLENAKMEIETWKEKAKAAVGGPPGQDARAQSRATEQAVKAFEEQKEQIERDAEKKALAAEAAYQKKVNEIINRKLPGQEPAAMISQKFAAEAAAASGNPPAAAGGVEVRLRDAWKALQAEKRAIGVWEVEQKIVADKQHDAASDQHKELSKAVHAQQAAYAKIDREAELKVAAAYRAYEATVARIEEQHPAEFIQFTTALRAAPGTGRMAVNAAAVPQPSSPALFYLTFCVSMGFVGFMLKTKVLPSLHYHQL